MRRGYSSSGRSVNDLRPPFPEDIAVVPVRGLPLPYDPMRGGLIIPDGQQQARRGIDLVMVVWVRVDEPVDGAWLPFDPAPALRTRLAS